MLLRAARCLSRPSLSSSSLSSSTLRSLSTAPAADKAADAVLQLDIRVGQIVDLKVHPAASGLYVEEVDLGPLGKRTIVSGLAQHCTKESLMGRRVVAVLNLKPRDFKGISSHGMLLCASNSEHSKVRV